MWKESESAYAQRYTWQQEHFTPDIYYEAGDIMTQVRMVNQILQMKNYLVEEVLVDPETGVVKEVITESPFVL